MNDKIIRHTVAAIGTAVAALAYICGYASAGHGWWLTILSVGVIYYALYTIINA